MWNMIQSNSQTVFAKLRSNISALQQLGKPNDQVTRTLLLTALALMKKRIFENGMNASMRGIGVYSSEYYNKVRKANGWSNRNITFELTGQMRNDFILTIDSGAWAIGFIGNGGAYSYKYDFSGKKKSKNYPSKSKGVKTVTKSALDSGKRARMLEKRFGTVFEMTAQEEMDIKKAFEYEVKRRLNG